MIGLIGGIAAGIGVYAWIGDDDTAGLAVTGGIIAGIGTAIPMVAIGLGLILLGSIDERLWQIAYRLPENDPAE